MWYNSFIPKTNTSRKIRKGIKISWIKLYQLFAQNAILKNFINSAKISLKIKSTNAVFVNINLRLNLSSTSPNILHAPLAVRLHSYITIMMITIITDVVIKNAITRSLPPNLPLSCRPLCPTLSGRSSFFHLYFTLPLIHRKSILLRIKQISHYCYNASLHCTIILT